MKYRIKEPYVEAFQYDGDFKDSNGNYYVPEWAVKALEDGMLRFGIDKLQEKPWELFLEQNNETWIVSVGDYVVLNMDKEIEIYSEELFNSTYEPV